MRARVRRVSEVLEDSGVGFGVWHRIHDLHPFRHRRHGQGDLVLLRLGQVRNDDRDRGEVGSGCTPSRTRGSSSGHVGRITRRGYDAWTAAPASRLVLQFVAGGSRNVWRGHHIEASAGRISWCVALHRARVSNRVARTGHECPSKHERRSSTAPRRPQRSRAIEADEHRAEQHHPGRRAEPTRRPTMRQRPGNVPANWHAQIDPRGKQRASTNAQGPGARCASRRRTRSNPP